MPRAACTTAYEFPTRSQCLRWAAAAGAAQNAAVPTSSLQELTDQRPESPRLRGRINSLALLSRATISAVAAPVLVVAYRVLGFQRRQGAAFSKREGALDAASPPPLRQCAPIGDASTAATSVPASATPRL
eukprot:818591-Pleurochrysis_carterae.AAC.4